MMKMTNTTKTNLSFRRILDIQRGARKEPPRFLTQSPNGAALVSKHQSLTKRR